MNTVIIDALLRAYDDGMDVITMSLGASDGWTTSPQAVVAQKLAARGKVECCNLWRIHQTDNKCRS